MVDLIWIHARIMEGGGSDAEAGRLDDTSSSSLGPQGYIVDNTVNYPTPTILRHLNAVDFRQHKPRWIRSPRCCPWLLCCRHCAPSKAVITRSTSRTPAPIPFRTARMLPSMSQLFRIHYSHTNTRSLTGLYRFEARQCHFCTVP